MRTTLKTGLIAAALLSSSSAFAGWSANLGFASDYYYRGIFQNSSSASGGVDFETGNFSAGTWVADVGDGLEVDGYFSYGVELDEVTLSAGYTGYFYTGDFDDTYQEINLGGGYEWLSVDLAFGQYDNFSGPTLDYTYWAATATYGGFYGKVAGFANDFEGEYLEAGYGATVSDIDLGVHLIFSNDELVGDADQSIVFTIGKSFDLQ